MVTVGSWPQSRERKAEVNELGVRPTEGLNCNHTFILDGTKGMDEFVLLFCLSVLARSDE